MNVSSNDVYESCTPPKRKYKRQLEKENDVSHSSKSNTTEKKVKKERSKVLTESPLPSTRANSKKLKDNDSSSAESDSEELDEMFLQLKKSGIKTVKSNLSDKKSPPSSKSKTSSNRKKPSLLQTPEGNAYDKGTTEGRSRFKKKLLEDFENVNNSVSNKRRSSRANPEAFVPELEKLPEDLILTHKRTPRQTQRFELECTPKKSKSTETPSKSSSRRKLTSHEEIINNVETTPKRSTRTPRKSLSVQRTPRTPTTPLSKIQEERVPTTPLEKARLSLHVAAIPEGLPCREKEYNNIYTFLKNKLWDGIGGCMYISGVPGTGKTATVTQAIRNLQKCAKNCDIPDFKFIEINGMRLSDPRQAYVQIWQKLFNKDERIPSDRAQKALDNWFSKRDTKNEKKTTVLLVDELDLICTKKQDVVYNLLDWPTRTHSRLVVLTIANTMDMPERLFKGRITSRMGLTRLTFMPYTFKQLEEIVLERLKGLDAFVPDAVQLVTRKVAAVSGDARRALDICRRAAELPAPDETVKISHIETAIKEMTNSNIVKVIRSCSAMEKLFLRSLCDVTFRSNVEEVDMLNVIDQFYSICILEGIHRPTISSILSISNRLKCSRLVFTNQSGTGILQRVMLNVTQDDIHYALQS
ncbi:hypothetical protein RUM43_007426 [Polyplax serrata]|uniref:Origin recognition complex subunit 1 n=1 Tax=Polyplax serrata TaxID=468196 RepID=A0AAN8PMM2_POLSC